MPKNSTTVNTYLEALRLIEKDIAKSEPLGGYYRRRLFLDAAIAIYVWKHQPDGRHGIAIEVHPSAVKPLKLSHSTKGFVVSTELDHDTEGRKICRVVIALGDPAFVELFTELIGHLLDHIVDAPSDRDAMVSLQSQLLLWRKFLDRGAEEGLSDGEQTGLFGELSFLQHCIDSGMPLVAVLDAWTGPNGSNQDFTIGSLAIEIKSSAANDANRIRISNLRQLDGTGLEQLFLYHFAYDRRQSSGTTLPQLVELLAARVKEQDEALAILFDELLLAAGYLHSHSHLYKDIGYSLRYENAYQVDEGFPRILEQDLAAGLSEVRFTIDLAVAVSQRLDCEVIFEALGDSQT